MMHGKFYNVVWLSLSAAIAGLVFAPPLADGSDDAGLASADGGKWRDVIADYRLQCKSVADALREDALWNHPDRAKELGILIQAAGELRAEEAVDPLIENIWKNTVSSDLKNERRLLSFEERYPAVQALASIGLPTIEPLLATMKAERKSDDDALRAAVAVIAFRMVFEGTARTNGANDLREREAVVLARLRIRQEIAHSNAEEKERLNVALNHPILHLSGDEDEAGL